MFVEMEQMASRPFSVVEVEIEKRNTAHSNQIPTISVSSNLRKRKVVSIVYVSFYSLIIESKYRLLLTLKSIKKKCKYVSGVSIK